MIPVRIDHDGQNDNYRALALYIADATIGTTQGEKTLHSWYTGGEADNYLEGMIEVEETQSLKPGIEDKTYHLVVSFRPEDEPILSKDVLQEIESILAASLGYSDHQRHCGVHMNTDNLHLHVAFNKVNPKTLNIRTPYYDFPKLHRACRLIEQKFGLTEDKGMDTETPNKEPKANAKVRSYESQTGQESLYNYVLRHKESINQIISQAASWRDIHKGFLKIGLTLKLAGNGLRIKDRYGKHHVKPSALDRAFSKNHLENKFGPFQEPGKDLLHNTQAAETYTARPLHQGPDRDGLYDAFQTEMRQRKDSIEAIKKEGKRIYQASKDDWKNKKDQIKKIPMLSADRQRVLNSLKMRELDELQKLKERTNGELKSVREKMPYTTWVKFLQHKAGQGNETALAVLRSKRQEIKPEGFEQTAPPEKVYSNKLKWLQDQNVVLGNSGLMKQNRDSLISVIKMREILSENSIPDVEAGGFSFKIDTKGIVLFRLKGVGVIRDTGTEIHFRGNNAKINELALKYAGARFGRNIEPGSGKIARTTQERQKNQNNSPPSRGR